VTTSRVEIEVPDALSVEVTSDSLKAELSDGRTLWVPLAWYPRLAHGRPEERNNWRLIGTGQGIHWDELDENVSVEGLLAGRHSTESHASFKRWLEGRAASRGAR